MSQQNVEAVRAIIEDFNRGDYEAALSRAAPDLVFDLSRATGPFRGVFALDQARSFLNDLSATWEASRIEPHELIEVGEQVVVPWTYSATGRGGIEVRSRTTWTFAFRAGAVARLSMYQERREALEAARLAG